MTHVEGPPDVRVGDADPVLDANRHAEFKHMIRHFGAEFTRLTQALRR